jgi:hypothetical protein
VLVFFSSPFHQHQQRVFVERLFYLVLNNVELTHFSTFNASSIINLSKELEKYQRLTNKTILNTGKLNTVVQFVLSFSSSSISSFQLNNLFYLLLNDMNDFSGKIIDRIAELLRTYHSITYGHIITKQYLITTVRNEINKTRIDPMRFTYHFSMCLTYCMLKKKEAGLALRGFHRDKQNIPRKNQIDLFCILIFHFPMI